MNTNPIDEQLKVISANPEASKTFVDLVARSKHKPAGWSRRSQAPYFKEKYALELKAILDQMEESRYDGLYPLNKFENSSIDTLYLRVNQSWRYLLEFLDPDKKYAKLAEVIFIRKKKAVGIHLCFNAEYRHADLETVETKAVLVEPHENIPAWRDRLDEWLESDATHPFVAEKLLLTPEQIRELKVSFSNTPSILANVTATSIKVVKLNS